MIKYIVASAGEYHSVEAVTFTQANDLRFIGEQGAIVAIFNHFEWLKVVPAEAKIEPTEALSTEKPELGGE